MVEPTIYFADDLVSHGNQCQAQVKHPDGRNVWVAGRPLSLGGFALRKRLRCAWLVFTGRADVVKWHG